MKKEEIISWLEKLAIHCDAMNVCNDSESVWQKDVEALNTVVDLLKEEVSAGEPIDTIKSLLERDGLSQQNLADRMGILRQNVSQMLNRGKNDMKYSNFKKAVSVLGYEVVLRKKQNKSQNFKK